MRTEGIPSAPTVARAMALGSLGSDFAASAYQASNWRKGSPQGRPELDSVMSESASVMAVPDIAFGFAATIATNGTHTTSSAPPPSPLWGYGVDLTFAPGGD